MQLQIELDTVYLVLPGTCGRIAAYFYLHAQHTQTKHIPGDSMCQSLANVLP